MHRYPSLRIAYIDEVEAPTINGMTEKTYYSVLVKGVAEKYDEVLTDYKDKYFHLTAFASKSLLAFLIKGRKVQFLIQ
jgi:hypothetical protein